MKLFLSGGGSGNESIELDKKFVASLDLSKPLLYIPIAIDTARHPYPGCLAWLKGGLGPLGVMSIVMWTEEDLANKNEKDFEQFGGIYVGGGNTYKLLKELREFGTLDILRKLAQKNMPIYGGSAGAIILAKTIIPACFLDENKSGVTDFSALDLIHGFDVWCHYTGNEDLQIREYIEKFNLEKVIGVPETSGLFVTESSIVVVGPSYVKVFYANNTTREVLPGLDIDLYQDLLSE